MPDIEFNEDYIAKKYLDYLLKKGLINDRTYQEALKHLNIPSSE